MQRNIIAQDVVHYITSYRYGENAMGENGLFNCWGLVRDVYSKFFNIQLPKSNLGDPLAELHQERINSKRWVPIDAPIHGAGVLMRDGQEPHCGVWLDFDGGGVLHCERINGVRFQSISDLNNNGYSKLRFYRIYE